MPRVKILGPSAVYHCISRVVGGQFLLETEEREHLRRLIRYQARFSGIQIITHSILSNHFHIVLRVPPAHTPSDATLLQRVQDYYGADHPLVRAMAQDMTQAGQLSDSLRQLLLRRMGDVSAFMKELKQRFSRWYNRRHDRFGTLWAERFKSLLVEDRPSAVAKVAAYVDLNAVRAGLVADPKDYPACGYAEAVAGDPEARSGIASFHEPTLWTEVADQYRRLLYVTAGSPGSAGKAVLDRQAIQQVLRSGGRLEVAELLRLRIRYFTDGVAFGSESFVEAIFGQFRSRFGPRRRQGARPLRSLGWRDLRVLRDLRVNVVG